MPTILEAIELAKQALQAGEFGQLEQLCAAILAADHLQPEAWHLRGVAAHIQGQNYDGHLFVQRAVDLQSDIASYHYNLGVIQQTLSDEESAEASYRRTLELDPQFRSAASNLGLMLKRHGRFSENVALFRDLAETTNEPHYLAVLGNAWKMEGDIEASVDAYRRAIEAEPNDSRIHSELLFALQYDPRIDDEELVRQHSLWNDQHGVDAKENSPDLRRSVKPGSAIRVGFVSPDLGNHPVGVFLAPIFERLNRELIRPICYSDRIDRDEYNGRLRNAVEQWRDTKSQSDEQMFDQIQSDQIDVLIDLAGHTDGNRLRVFARRAAPIQITWAGYVGTTGVPAIDYLLCDAFHIPPELESHCCETPLRMPHGYICYAPPEYAPDPGPPPSSVVGHVTFGSLNNPSKINDEVARVWSEILKRVPDSKLLLKYKGFDDAGVQDVIHDRFSRQGIVPDRITMLGGTNHVEHLSVCRDIDIALDTFPYSGGLTTCEAIWMGLPVVTCPSARFASRHSLSHLRNSGYDEAIAGDLDEYVEIAVSLAGDASRLAGLRNDLRERMAGSPLCDIDRFVRDFEAVIAGTVLSDDPK